MLSPRKLTFQLTPLLDLLLIVIFAQYMEVQQTVQRGERRSAAQAAEARERIQTMGRRLAALQAESNALESELAERRQEFNELLQGRLDEQAEFQRQRVELTEALREARRQRDRIGELAVELFNLPESAIDRAVDPAPAAGQRSPQEIEALKEQFRAMGRMRADEMVKHLLAVGELRKRVDLWEVYITENGIFQFTTGRETFQFRANDAETFVTTMFRYYKSLPQPKSLVVILLSYGDAKAVWREAALSGLPQLAERMQADSNGRTRFEYSVLGFRPEGPVAGGGE